MTKNAIKILMALLTMKDLTAHVIDVRRAFLKGRFGDDEKYDLQIPKGFERHRVEKNNIWTLTGHFCILERNFSSQWV